MDREMMDMDKNKWIEWAKELQDLSQCALGYCRDPYDIERFQRIREISAEMMSDITDLPVQTVRDLFCSGDGYQTPKIETRGAVFRDGRILLVQERDGQWCMPGGWVDYDLSVRTNTVKEVLEEAGMRVEAVRLIALEDRNRHHPVRHFHEICSILVLCEYISGDFVPNTETVACGWFPPDALPKLNEGKTTYEHVELCFRAAQDPNWQTLFD